MIAAANFSSISWIVRLSPRFLARRGLGTEAINAGPAPINLVMFTQASQHGLVQLLPDTSGVLATFRGFAKKSLPQPQAV